MILPRSRTEAKKASSLYYFTGKGCVHGHFAKRRTGNGACYECMKARHNIYHREKYYPKNKEKRKARAKKHYEDNKEVRLVEIKLWSENNKEKVKYYKRKNKYMRRSIESVGMSWAELKAWCENQRKICHWCGIDCESNYHTDHYIPLSKGGKHQAENLVVSCPACNFKKSAKMPEEFIYGIKAVRG